MTGRIVDTPVIVNRWQPATLDLTHQEHKENTMTRTSITTPTAAEAWADYLGIELSDETLARLDLADEDDWYDDDEEYGYDLAVGMTAGTAVGNGRDLIDAWADHVNHQARGTTRKQRHKAQEHRAQRHAAARAKASKLPDPNSLPGDNIPRDHYGTPTYQPTRAQAARDLATGDRLATAYAARYSLGPRR